MLPRRSSPVAILFERKSRIGGNSRKQAPQSHRAAQIPLRKSHFYYCPQLCGRPWNKKNKKWKHHFFYLGKNVRRDFSGLTFQTVALFLFPSALTWTACAFFPRWWVVCCVLFLFAPFWQTMRSPPPPLSPREFFQASPSSSRSSRDVRLRFFLLQHG